MIVFRNLSSYLSAVCCFGVSAFFMNSSVLAEPLSAEQWYQQGEAAVLQAKAVKANKKRAKNIILFVGDGMGISTITAARILEGQLKGGNGEDNSLAFEQFDNVALSKTYNTNQQTPDSAGTMTAMVTGVKTRAGMLSVPPSVLRGDCSADQAQLETILDMAERGGKASGIVTTAAVTHATPGALYAHVSERNWQADSRLSAVAQNNGCEDIAAQLIGYSEGNGLELVLGGGRRDFFPSAYVDIEGVNGRRSDDRYLVREWLAAADNKVYVETQAQFDRLKPDGQRQILGLFNPNHMQFEIDRKDDVAGEPSLASMTSFAVKHLQAASSKKGFFLMVEAGRIDHGHHAGNAARALHDTLALSDAVAATVELVDLDDTLIIVTADHSHVMTMAGYPTRGNPILGHTVSNDEQGKPMQSPALDLSGKPYTTLTYANGPGYIEGCDADVDGVHVGHPDYLQRSAVPLNSETHGGEDVAIFAAGAGAHLIRGVQEQNVIFHAMKIAAEL